MRGFPMTIVLTLLAVLAALALLWRLGYRGVAWSLPAGAGLLWLAAAGYATAPWVVAATGAVILGAGAHGLALVARGPLVRPRPGDRSSSFVAGAAHGANPDAESDVLDWIPRPRPSGPSLPGKAMNGFGSSLPAAGTGDSAGAASAPAASTGAEAELDGPPVPWRRMLERAAEVPVYRFREPSRGGRSSGGSEAAARNPHAFGDGNANTVPDAYDAFGDADPGSRARRASAQGTPSSGGTPTAPFLPSPQGSSAGAVADAPFPVRSKDAARTADGSQPGLRALLSCGEPGAMAPKPGPRLLFHPGESEGPGGSGSGVPSGDGPGGDSAEAPLARVRRRTLLESITAHATAAQRASLVAALGVPGERLHALRVSPRPATPLRLAIQAPMALGRAVRTERRRWGSSHPAGVLLEFVGEAPGTTTVLAVLAEVVDERGGRVPRAPAGSPGDAQGRQRRALVLVPTDLPAVKRLDPASQPDARWVARGVFVPLHLIVGEEGGIGAGDAIVEGQSTTPDPPEPSSGSG